MARNILAGLYLYTNVACHPALQVNHIPLLELNGAFLGTMIHKAATLSCYTTASAVNLAYDAQQAARPIEPQTQAVDARSGGYRSPHSPRRYNQE